jgi:hypothetical protein
MAWYVVKHRELYPVQAQSTRNRSRQSAVSKDADFLTNKTIPTVADSLFV